MAIITTTVDGGGAVVVVVVEGEEDFHLEAREMEVDLEAGTFSPCFIFCVK